LKGNFYRIFKR